MRKIIYILGVVALLSSCKADIKNRTARIEIEEGTEVKTEGNSELNNLKLQKETQKKTKSTAKDFTGFYVGDFRNAAADDYGKNISVDEGFYWDRTNKINISIDKIEDTLIMGHSVVAGNDRPFNGVIKKVGQGVYSVVVKEPGDDKYDGVFKFELTEAKLKGTWEAYKNIDIKIRKYDLKKTSFRYDANVMLEQNQRYVNWKKFVSKKEKYEDEVETWIYNNYSSATDLIYEVNASNRLLKKDEVENMKKGDLLIIRNAIYARHGYSFKNRPLRVFFDAQSWYIPVHTDIKKEFTEIEKKNIRLLMKYEKNAREYYDYFGRG